MEKQSLDVTKVKEYLLSQIKGSGWDDAFFFFLNSEDLERILIQLRDDIENTGISLTPKLKYVFRPFSECPLRTVKVVIFYPEPPPFMDKSDGLALSCSSSKDSNKVLKLIQSEISATVYPDKPYEVKHNLDVWAHQGVLLLNLTPTTRILERFKHVEIWRPFTQMVVDTLVRKCSDAVFVIIGDGCNKFMREVSGRRDNNIVWIQTTDPFSTTISVGGKKPRWDSGNLFNRVNEELAKKGKTPITW